MIRLSLWEQIVSVIIQIALWVLYPWQAYSRWDTVLCLIVLGVCAVAILGIVEWSVEHLLKIKIPG